MAEKNKTAGLGPIDTTAVYPLPVFMQRAGLSRWAFRQARRAGLKVKTVGRRRYVLGSDWHEFLSKMDD